MAKLLITTGQSSMLLRNGTRTPAPSPRRQRMMPVGAAPVSFYRYEPSHVIKISRPPTSLEDEEARAEEARAEKEEMIVMHDLATWRMYHRIMDARHRREAQAILTCSNINNTNTNDANKDRAHELICTKIACCCAKCNPLPSPASSASKRDQEYEPAIITQDETVFSIDI